jgi:hypothetical protein
MSFQERLEAAKTNAKAKSEERKAIVANAKGVEQKAQIERFNKLEAERDERMVHSLDLLGSLMEKIEPSRWRGGKIAMKAEAKPVVKPEPKPEPTELVQQETDKTACEKTPAKPKFVFESDTCDTKETSDSGEEIVIRSRRRRKKPSKPEHDEHLAPVVEAQTVVEVQTVKPPEPERQVEELKPEYLALFGM